MAAALKVYVFVAGQDPFDQERLRLRERLQVTNDPPSWLWIDTAENSVLRKLERYRRGGEVSEWQWRDVVAILRIQGPSIHQSHLYVWGKRLEVTDLLERARVEAREGG